MAFGPDDILKPNVTDLEWMTTLEAEIDGSDTFMKWRSGVAVVAVNHSIMKQFLSVRGDIRLREVIKRYQRAGWFTVDYDPATFTFRFNGTDCSAGRS